MAGNELINGLLEKSRKLDQLRIQEEEVLLDINKLHKKLMQSAPEMLEKPGDSILLKLRSLYTRAKELSEREASVSNELVSHLDALLQSGSSAAQQKKIEVSERKKKRFK